MYGKQLKTARKQKNMTLQQVATLLSTTHATISRYENEKLEPGMETLKSLCALYNISADYILGLPKDMPYPPIG